MDNIERTLQELENQMNVIKERDIIGDMMHATVKDAEAQHHVDYISLSAKFHKENNNEMDALDLITESEARERAAQARILREMFDKLHDNHATVQKDILERRRLLTKERCSIDNKLAALRKEFHAVQSNVDSIRKEQQQLQLQQLQVGNEPNEDDLVVPIGVSSAMNTYDDMDDESMDNTYEKAEFIQKNIAERIASIQSRIGVIEDESKWVLSLPDNDLWKILQTRIKQSLDALNGVGSSNTEMKQYLDYITNKTAISTREDIRALFHHVTYAIAQQIIKEVEDMIVLDVCSSIMKTIDSCGSQLENCIINAILDIGSSHSRDVLDPIDMRNKRVLFSGCIADLKAEMRVRDDEAYIFKTDFNQSSDAKAFFQNPLSATLSKAPSSTNFSRASRDSLTCPVESHLASRPLPTVVHLTPAIANGQFPRAKGKHNTHADNCKADTIEYVSDVILGFENEIPKQSLIALEKSHWGKVTLQTSLGGALLTTRVPGRVSFIQIIARPLLQLSILIVGTQFGQLLFWSIPWNGYHKVPLLTAVTPKLPENEQCEVLMIKECGVGGNQFLTMDSKNNIRVWTFNPMPEPLPSHSLVQQLTGLPKKHHTRTLFPKNHKDFAPLVPSCIFYFCPVELNIPPSPSLFPQAAETKQLNHLSKMKQIIQPQAYVVPSCVTFHPSLTLSNRNSSLMIGTVGGDCYKINMDYKENSLDAPILYLPPFIDVEYVQPSNAKSMNTILAPGVPARRGNKVYREMFHYHKSKIVLMEVVHKVSDCVITMDEDGFVALWRYSKEQFVGKMWFVPVTTCKLDFHFENMMKDPKYIDRLHNTAGISVGLSNSDSLFNASIDLSSEQLKDLSVPGWLMNHVSAYASMTNTSEIPHLFAQFNAEQPSLTRNVGSTSVDSLDSIFFGNDKMLQASAVHKVPKKSVTKRLKKYKISQLCPGITSCKYYPVNVQLRRELNDGSSNALFSTNQTGVDDIFEHKEDDRQKTRNFVETVDIDHDPPMLVLFEKIKINIEYEAILDDEPRVINDRGVVAEEKLSISMKTIDGVNRNIIGEKVGEKSSAKVKRRYEAEFWRMGHVRYVAAASTLVQSIMTYDGLEIVFLLCSENTTQLHDVLTYHLVSMRASDLKFQGAIPTFTLPEGEAVISLQVGPILKETFTRFAFVLTSKRCRLFSLGTGQEILTQIVQDNKGVKKDAKQERKDGFPLTISDMLQLYPSFAYYMCDLCPMQRMLVFGGPTDSRLAVYLFRHEDDRQPAKNSSDDSHQKLYDKLVKEQQLAEANTVVTGDKKHLTIGAFSRPIKELDEVAIFSVLGSSKLDVTTHERQIKEDALRISNDYEFIHHLLEEVFTQLNIQLDKLIVYRDKERCIREIYTADNHAAQVGDGTKLGVIEPVTWPKEPLSI